MTSYVVFFISIPPNPKSEKKILVNQGIKKSGLIMQMCCDMWFPSMWHLYSLF